MDNSGLPKSQATHLAPRRVPILKARLAPSLTCPLCNSIFREATTINECMHTFCKNCIYQKLQTEGITCCPTCNEDLSHLSPEDYLRPDESWRNLVKLYLGESSSNDQGETAQATPPPSVAANASESTAEPLTNENKNPHQSPKEPTESEQSSC